MKKVLIMLSFIFTLVLSGCVITTQPYYIEPENQTLTFVEAKFVEYYDDKECVGLFFDYTNDSGVDKCPGTEFFIGVNQNEEPLGTLWLGEPANEALGAATNISTGTTVRVVYLFVLYDDSPLLVAISDGRKFTISYEQIGEMRKT